MYMYMYVHVQVNKTKCTVSSQVELSLDTRLNTCLHFKPSANYTYIKTFSSLHTCRHTILLSKIRHTIIITLTFEWLNYCRSTFKNSTLIKN